MGATARPHRINRRVLETSDSLRLIAKCSIGVDDVDLDVATELGILVTHCPAETNWSGVAEGTVGMILGLLKMTRERDRQIKEGGWRNPPIQGTYMGARQDGYAGLTIGIVGLGRIGSRFADLMAPWRVNLLACDPYVDGSKFVHHNCIPADLETTLRESDIVSLHVTLDNETRHLIGAAELELMKSNAILINTARGPVIDEAALIEALQNDSIAGAALDVFEMEPLPADSGLRSLGDKVLLSPHMAPSNHGTNDGLGPGVEWATRSVMEALRGEVPSNVYNKEAIPLWRERFAGRSVLPGN
jgi:phosphoglycerate dehydrogenase-like enzyme